MQVNRNIFLLQEQVPEGLRKERSERKQRSFDLEHRLNFSPCKPKFRSGQSLLAKTNHFSPPCQSKKKMNKSKTLFNPKKPFSFTLQSTINSSTILGQRKRHKKCSILKFGQLEHSLHKKCLKHFFKKQL